MYEDEMNDENEFVWAWNENKLYQPQTNILSLGEKGGNV